jgi:hypothetical protein
MTCWLCYITQFLIVLAKRVFEQQDVLLGEGFFCQGGKPGDADIFPRKAGQVFLRQVFINV